MSRIRSVHPGLWTDSAFINVSMPAGLFFIGLWNFADDNGVFEWHPQALKLRIMAGRRVNIQKLLNELLEQKLIEHYQIEKVQYGKIHNFRKWQKPQKPFYKYPDKDGSVPVVMSSFRENHGCIKQDKNRSVIGNDHASIENNNKNSGLVKLSTIGREKERKSKGKEEEISIIDNHKKDFQSCFSDQQDKVWQGLCLSENWQPDADCQAYAESLGLNLEETIENFRDYWLAKAGKEALKRDWNAVWRSWCRKSRDWQLQSCNHNDILSQNKSINVKKHPLDWMVNEYNLKWNDDE